MAEQIWVLVQARPHLMAETLRVQMHIIVFCFLSLFFVRPPCICLCKFYLCFLIYVHCNLGVYIRSTFLNTQFVPTSLTCLMLNMFKTNEVFKNLWW